MLNACCFASASFQAIPIPRPEGAGLTGSDLRPLLLTMLVLHPSSSCDICYDTYGQENPASTIPCGHIFCYRFVWGLGRSRRNTRHFHSSAFARALLSTDVFPCADRACARCVERSSRALMSRNSERPTLGMVEPKRSFVAQFLPHRARQPVGSNDGTP
jgi:hypothetical protein